MIWLFVTLPQSFLLYFEHASNSVPNLGPMLLMLSVLTILFFQSVALLVSHFFQVSPEVNISERSSLIILST
jgi:hypothetical protein